MNTKELIKKLIIDLPLTKKDKDELLAKLEQEGVEVVKEAIKNILESLALQVQAKQEMDSAAREFNEKMDKLGKKAQDFYADISKQLDQIELEQARSSITNQ